MFRFLLLTVLVALAWSQNAAPQAQNTFPPPQIPPATPQNAPAPQADDNKKTPVTTQPIASDVSPIAGIQAMPTTDYPGSTTTVIVANATTTKPTEPSGKTTTTEAPSSAITVGAFSAVSLCALSLVVVI